MQSKLKRFSNFSNAISTTSEVFRPEDEEELSLILQTQHHGGILARGSGLSYSDCCVNHQGKIIDTTRLNHILSFDPTTGIAVCQSAVLFRDLFLLSNAFIPPIIPGTLFSTIAGGVANDVHGKNNPHMGSLGHHIEWINLELNHQTLKISPLEHPELFHATIAGLGLTGVIKHVALRLTKASHYVLKKNQKFTSLTALLEYMQHEGLSNDYQVAWLDLLNTPRALLSTASHIEPNPSKLNKTSLNFRPTVPKLPIRFITPFAMKQFNRLYFKHVSTKPTSMPLWAFNNPLDAINQWNRIYGKQGLVQFQAVFSSKDAITTINSLLALIRSHNASPLLAVLKYFTQKGKGLLSFAEPGFTLAIDFIHDTKARLAIMAMNQLITRLGGKVYLAKDLFLEHEQFKNMYPEHEVFNTLLTSIHRPASSDIYQRLIKK
jgi:decaprenylphospho-beta-D-ribofuranose 2-oxidase